MLNTLKSAAIGVVLFAAATYLMRVANKHLEEAFEMSFDGWG